MIFNMDAKTIGWGKTVFSTNSAEKTGQSHAKVWSWILTSHHTKDRSRPKRESSDCETLRRKQGKWLVTLDLAMISWAWHESTGNEGKTGKPTWSKWKTLLQRTLWGKWKSNPENRRKCLQIIHLGRAQYPDCIKNSHNSTSGKKKKKTPA